MEFMKNDFMLSYDLSYEISEYVTSTEELYQ
jgi:hypothetical protein